MIMYLFFAILSILVISVIGWAIFWFLFGIEVIVEFILPKSKLEELTIYSGPIKMTYFLGEIDLAKKNNIQLPTHRYRNQQEIAAYCFDRFGFACRLDIWRLNRYSFIRNSGARFIINKSDISVWDNNSKAEIKFGIPLDIEVDGRILKTNVYWGYIGESEKKYCIFVALDATLVRLAVYSRITNYKIIQINDGEAFFVEMINRIREKLKMWNACTSGQKYTPN